MNPLKEFFHKDFDKELLAIPSYCSANVTVIDTVLKRAKETKRPCLIEATANQVNQYGGYTGMTPDNFYKLVMSKAKGIGLKEEKVILGGDHLGPLIWQDKKEDEAMELASELVRQYVLAGFKKIHLDTSMKLSNDGDKKLSTYKIANRGLKLYEVAIDAYEERKKVYPESVKPVFVIGSEVPIPGGVKETKKLKVTDAKDFCETVEIYMHIFNKAGYKKAFEDIIAIVVQPGVEYGEEEIHYYNPSDAKELTLALKTYGNLVFEGHSTDYQSIDSLHNMAKDGVGILKVGPELTYSFREALFSLENIEKELIEEGKRSRFSKKLDKVMIENPFYWENYYQGTDRELAFARKYSYSDRSRYYLNKDEIEKAINSLYLNLDSHGIPMTLLHQFMPIHYKAVVEGELELKAKELAEYSIKLVLMRYEKACKK